MGQRWKVGEHGFTLLELVVTLMVLAFALAVVGPAVGPIAETIRARTEVVRLAALLRHTREQAIATGRSRVLVVDPPAHRVSILIGEEVRESRALPEHLDITAEPPAALSVRFEPQGTSNGGAFLVAASGVRYRMTVDPLTGRVRIDRQ